jgi:hypothetical protein
MMGRQTVDQSQLFYLFNLERRIPDRHLPRRTHPIVTRILAEVRTTPERFYSEIGRPSIDPELLIFRHTEEIGEPALILAAASNPRLGRLRGRGRDAIGAAASSGAAAGADIAAGRVGSPIMVLLLMVLLDRLAASGHHPLDLLNTLRIIYSILWGTIHSIR